ncbi:unnamed protein product, partial [Musa acuminata subsp. burmannicoides]
DPSFVFGVEEEQKRASSSLSTAFLNCWSCRGWWVDGELQHKTTVQESCGNICRGWKDRVTSMVPEQMVNDVCVSWRLGIYIDRLVSINALYSSRRHL